MIVAHLKHVLAGSVLITGGAGFIGSNLADALLREGRDVIIFDNLSRKGVEQNLHWLTRRHGKRLTFRAGDLRDAAAVAAVVGQASSVAHLAAQVAVTASLADPWEDFSVNLLGTMHVLEAIRRKGVPMPLVFASTNKVSAASQPRSAAIGICRGTRPSRRRASARRRRCASPPPMAAPRERPTNMSSTMREASAFRPWCCA